MFTLSDDHQLIKETVGKIAAALIVAASMAEEALAAALGNGAEMTRAQIADPDLVAKLAAGTPERVRPCILCNQACRVRDARNPLVSRIGEPSVATSALTPPSRRGRASPHVTWWW